MRRRPKEIAQSSDIAFLLIFFFLLLAGLESSKALTLQQSTATISSQETTISLVLEADGSVRYQGTPLTGTNLENLLATVKQADISIQDTTPWQNVVDLLSLANQTGTEVSIHGT